MCINLAEELNLIQMQIQRMGSNSFIIKGWYITAQIGLIAYLYKNTNFGIDWLILIVPFIFCSVYDAYFLKLERIYREKYKWNVEKNGSVDLNKRLELNPKNILDILKDDGKNIKELTVKSIFFNETIGFWNKNSEKLFFKIYVLPVIIMVIIA